MTKPLERPTIEDRAEELYRSRHTRTSLPSEETLRKQECRYRFMVTGGLSFFDYGWSREQVDAIVLYLGTGFMDDMLPQLYRDRHNGTRYG